MENRIEARTPAGLLAGSAHQGLLVVASSHRDPDLAPFVGGSRLGQSLVVVTPGGDAHLAYLTPMERGEAARTGLELLDPESLDVLGLLKECSGEVPFLAAIVRRSLERCAVSDGEVALAGHAAAGALHEVCRSLESEGRWSFVAGHEKVLAWRKRKLAEEVGEVRRAAEGTMAAMRRVAELLAEAHVESGGELVLGGDRLTVERLRREVSRVVAGFGLDQPEGNILAPAEEGSVPHNAGTPDRILRSGQSLIVDLFPRGRLFADCTRTFCVGTAPPELLSAHAAVEDALRVALRSARAGVSAWELQRRTCEAFQGLGYATPISDPGTVRGYVHGLGHGVGYELHEYPSFRKAADPAVGTLAVGDVLTLEPGLYDEELGYGVRLEDLCHLGEGGLENLTPLPYDLDPRAWRVG